jgi:hypothetical protein
MFAFRILDGWAEYEIQPVWDWRITGGEWFHIEK